MRNVSLLISAILLMAGVTLLTIPARSTARLQSGILVYEVHTEREGTRSRAADAAEAVRIWFRGPYFRSESWHQNVLRHITINAADGCSMLDPMRREAIRLPEGGVADTMGVPGFELVANRGYKKVASEKIGRFETDVLAPQSDARSGLEIRRVWMSREFLDLKVKEVIKRPDQGIQITTVLKSAQLNVSISDSKFRVPVDTTFRTAPTGPSGDRLPGGGGRALSPEACLNRLAVAVRRYARAHGESLPPMRNQRALLDAVEPYLADRASYGSPAMGPPFLPVGGLAGKPLRSLRGGPRRVILYRARPEPDGRRLVAYLDCHVEAVTAREWQRLVREQQISAK